jgi:hypothetical protein
VLVARAHRVSPEELRSAREILDRVGSSVVGIVLQPERRGNRTRRLLPVRRASGVG